MDTYTTVKNRILQLLGEKKMPIHKLAMESAVAPSSIKNILYGKMVWEKSILITYLWCRRRFLMYMEQK